VLFTGSAAERWGVEERLAVVRWSGAGKVWDKAVLAGFYRDAFR
jgi:hypothetical protein